MNRSRDINYYAHRWATCHVLPGRVPFVERAVARVLAVETEYRAVEELTGVPWRLVGALHYREANCSPECGLHNGQTWRRATTLVPAGRGPFGSWIDSAHDALIQARMQGHEPEYWTVPRQLLTAERYNGWGYAMRDRPSPYVWNWTNHGVGAGYFTADGKYDPDAVNKQAGVAAILRQMETQHA